MTEEMLPRLVSNTLFPKWSHLSISNLLSFYFASWYISNLFSDFSAIKYNIIAHFDIHLCCFMGEHNVIQTISRTTQTPQHKTKGETCEQSNELFSKFKIVCLATRSARSVIQNYAIMPVFKHPPIHPLIQTPTYHTGNVCIHAHIHVQMYIVVNCSCKVQSFITKARSGGQILNLTKSLLNFEKRPVN